MHGRLLAILDGVMRVVGRWPRYSVLKASGEPVEILEVRDVDGRRRCRVETRDGRSLDVSEAELTARLAGNGIAVAIGIVLVAACVLFGGTGGLEAVEAALEDIAGCAATLDLAEPTP